MSRGNVKRILASGCGLSSFSMRPLTRSASKGRKRLPRSHRVRIRSAGCSADVVQSRRVHEGHSRIERITAMKLSARNQLKGTVRAISPGAVNVEITIELPGGQTIVSIITKASADELKLKVGGSVYAVIKASNVILGVD